MVQIAAVAVAAGGAAPAALVVVAGLIVLARVLSLSFAEVRGMTQLQSVT